ncbi:hypothetical protein AB1Y20_019393 [Prymnesium parvum]|uniref:holo-[acyl-carrier-protein] synthase n=1 Tax=Prymnesium parvum TaxID=97485 RepID=A0AB34JVS0_PRYPA
MESISRGGCTTAWHPSKRRMPSEAHQLAAQLDVAVSISVPTPSRPKPDHGVLRWIVDISTWSPAPEEFDFLLSTLQEEEQAKVVRYKFEMDKKRALVSRLLQRRACAEATGVKQSEVIIQRTKGAKPYMANRPHADSLPNWNFNVSHEGNYVAIAAEPSLLCGVDVAAPEQVRSKAGRSLESIFQLFKDQCTEKEWRYIRSCGPSESAMENAFRKHWSLKEAYTKARGDGLGFEFKKCEFVIHPTEGEQVEVATVTVEGTPLPLWKFYIQPAGANHWLSVARGPPTDVVDAFGVFTKTFRRPVLSADEMRQHLERPESSFEAKYIRELVPQEMLQLYLNLVPGAMARCSE